MIAIKETGKQAIVRRQILVIESNIIGGINKETLRNSILEQMKDGVVIVPAGYTAKVCDADAVIVTLNDGELRSIYP